MNRIDFENFSNEWYESVKDQNSREDLVRRHPSSMMKIDKRLFFVEHCLKRFNLVIAFERMADETHWGHITFFLDRDSVASGELKVLLNTQIVIEQVVYGFDCAEAVIDEVNDFNPYSDDNRYHTSHYPKMSLVFRRLDN